MGSSESRVRALWLRGLNELGVGRDQFPALLNGKGQKAAVIDCYPVTEGEIDGKRKKRALSRVEINSHVLDGFYGELDIRGVESRIESQSIGQFVEQEIRCRESALVSESCIAELQRAIGEVLPAEP